MISKRHLGRAHKGVKFAIYDSTYILLYDASANRKLNLEYNITFPSIEKTGRKPCFIREHIIGIVMVSERDFDNVTCVWSCNVYAL